MALYVIATPIGVPSDISRRAVEVLGRCGAVIGEDHKNTSRFLKMSGVAEPEIYILNEHSKPTDLQELVDLAKAGDVALVSDCGTPAFCDPGADLVQLCHRQRVKVQSIPGPSSLMSFLSVCGHRLDQFLFRGFLPAENERRRQELEKMRKTKTPTIIMDTPYRMVRLLEDIDAVLPAARLVLGMELSTDSEQVIEGLAKEVKAKLPTQKAEFILLILP